MQGKFRLSVKARAEIKNIFRYSFQKFGESQAKKYKTSFDECFQLLADNPNMGIECHTIRNGYFRHKHESHVIFYTLRSNDIFITTIIHSRMDIKSVFGINDNNEPLT